jgi:hypothetical protein
MTLPKRERPRLHKITEEMKAWSAALQAEVLTWPGVATRGMFGFVSFYRRGAIFAALPRTRTMEPPDSIAFRLEAPSGRLREQLQQDSRILAVNVSPSRWLTYRMTSAQDLTRALYWLSVAYESAGAVRGKGSKKGTAKWAAPKSRPRKRKGN